MSCLQVLLRFGLRGKFLDYYEIVRDIKEGDIIAVYRSPTVIHYAYVYEVLQMHEPVPMCYHIHRLSPGYRRGVHYKESLLHILADKETLTNFDTNVFNHSEWRAIARSEMFIDNQESYAARKHLHERLLVSRQNLHEILEACCQGQVFNYSVFTTNCEHLTTNWRYESNNLDKPKAKAWSRQARLISWIGKQPAIQHVRNFKYFEKGSLFLPKLDDTNGDAMLELATQGFIESKGQRDRLNKWLAKKLQLLEESRNPLDTIGFTRDYENPQVLEIFQAENLDKFYGTVLVLQSSISRDRVSEYKRRQCNNPKHKIPAPGKNTSYLRDIADINVVVKLLQQNPQIKVFIWEKGFNHYMKKQWPDTKYKIIGKALKEYCPNLEHISVVHYDGEEQLFEPFINSKNCMRFRCIDCPTIPMSLISSCSKLLNFLGTDIQNTELIKFAISELEVSKISSRFIAEKLIPEFVETLCQSGKKVMFLDVFASYTRQQISNIATNLTSLKHITVEGPPSDVMLLKIEKLKSLYWVANFSSYGDDDPTSEIYGWPEAERHIALTTFAQVGYKLTSLQIKHMPMDMEFFNEVLKSCLKLKVLRVTLDCDRKGTRENRVMKFGPILETLKDTLTDLDLDGEWIDDCEHDLQQQLKDATKLRYLKVTNDLPTDDSNAIYNKIYFFCCFGLNGKLEIIFEKFEEIERFSLRSSKKSKDFL